MAWRLAVKTELAYIFAKAWIPALGKVYSSILAIKKAYFDNKGGYKLLLRRKITIQLRVENFYSINTQR